MRFTGFILLLLCACASGKAQNVQTVWKSMMSNYSSDKNYSMDITVKAFPLKAGEIVTYKGTVKKSGSAFSSTMQGITTVLNDKYLIQVNEHARTIRFSETEKKKGNKKKEPSLFPLDSLAEKTPKVKSKTDAEIVYLIDLEGHPVYRDMEIYVSVKDNSISKIVYHMSKSVDQAYDRTEIVYSNTRFATLPESVFSEQQYFELKGKKAVPAAKFNGYKVISQQELIEKNSHE